MARHGFPLIATPAAWLLPKAGKSGEVDGTRQVVDADSIDQEFGVDGADVSARKITGLHNNRRAIRARPQTHGNIAFQVFT